MKTLYDIVYQNINEKINLPISFDYNGKHYNGIGRSFKFLGIKNEKTRDGVKNVFEYSFKDGIKLSLEVKAYSRFEAVEWTAYFENAGKKTTKEISNLLAIDYEFVGKNPVLKGINGDLGEMYAPYEVNISKTAVYHESTSGRPTHGRFPYYNLEFGNGGAFIALGWPGCWKAYFSYDEENKTTVKMGQHTISTCLEPGEKIRTPLVAMLYYNYRNEDANMNLWRKWFIECNMYRSTSGEPIKPAFSATSMSQGFSTKKFLKKIDSYNKHDLKIDYFWMDAGWYTDELGKTCSWPNTGSLNMNTEMFPDRMKTISDTIHNQGGKTMLWFEPEVVRINKESFLKNTPEFKEEWMLGTAAKGSWLEGQLLDLGNPELRAWLLNKIFRVMDDGKIDMFRQDFNVNPADVWENYDKAKSKKQKAKSDKQRTGITENKYVQGYLTFWDEVLKRYPNMEAIDSCASGGGRNDLETLRRSVMLHVSDYWDGNPGGFDERQAVSLSLPSWIPYFKLQNNTETEIDIYKARCAISPWYAFNLPVSRKTNYNTAKKLYDEWNIIKDFYYKDFYPLTPYSHNNLSFRAWEYFDNDNGAGVVEIFRPEACPQEVKNIKLKGLNKDKVYVVRDTDGKISVEESGAALTKKGLDVNLPVRGSGVIVIIEKGSSASDKYLKLLKTIVENKYDLNEKLLSTALVEGATYLSDMEWLGGSCYDSKNNTKLPTRDVTVSGEELSIAEETFDKGICIHAIPTGGIPKYAYLEVNIEKLGAKNFYGYLGVADSAINDVTMGTVEFVITGDGKEIYRSGVLKNGEPAVAINLDIRGVKVLKIEVTDGGDGISGDWAVIGNGYLR